MVRIHQARQATLIILFTFGFSVMAWIPRIPEIKTNLNVSAATFGAVTSLGTLGAISSTFLASRILHSIGSRGAIALFGSGAYLSLSLIPLQHSVVTYGLVIAFYGACTSGLSASLNVQSLHIEERRGVPSMGAFHGWWAAGALLTGLASSALVNHLSLSIHVMALAVLAFIILWMALPRLLTQEEELSTADPAHDDTPSVRALLRPSRAALLIGLGLGSGGFAEYASGDWSAIYLRDVINSSLSHAAFAFTFIMGAITFSRLIGDRLTHHFGAQRIVQTAGVAIFGGVSLVAISGHFVDQLPSSIMLTLTYLGFGISGLGSGVMVPLFVSATSSITAVPRAIAIGQVILIQQTSVWIYKQLMAWLVAHIGLTNAILLPGLTALIAMALSGFTAAKPQARQAAAQ